MLWCYELLCSKMKVLIGGIDIDVLGLPVRVCQFSVGRKNQVVYTQLNLPQYNPRARQSADPGVSPGRRLLFIRRN